MKKRWLSLILSGIMVCSMSATVCVKAESVESDSELEGTIDIFQFKVEINDALQAATEAYMAENPGVTINLETVGGGDDYNAALRTKMQSNAPADIFNLGGPQDIKDWNGKLEDLSAEPWVANTVDGLLDDVTVDGKVYGMPMAIEGYGFVYNKEIFEVAGIDIESAKTLDDMDKAFGELQAKIDAGELKEQFPVLEAVFEYPAKETWVTGMHSANVALGQEFANCTEAFNAPELDFTYADGLKKFIDLQVKYSTSADDPSLLNAVDYSMQAGGGLAIERVAVIQQGNWVYPVIAEIDQEVADKLGLIAIPLDGVTEDIIPIGVPNYWTINTESSDNEKMIAKDFLNWLYQSEEGKNIVVNEFGFIPPFTNYGDIKPQDPLGAAVSAAADEGKVAPWVFYGCPTGWTDTLGREIQSYFAGEKTWDEAIESAKAEWAAARK